MEGYVKIDGVDYDDVVFVMDNFNDGNTAMHLII